MHGRGRRGKRSGVGRRRPRECLSLNRPPGIIGRLDDLADRWPQRLRPRCHRFDGIHDFLDGQHRLGRAHRSDDPLDLPHQRVGLLPDLPHCWRNRPGRPPAHRLVGCFLDLPGDPARRLRGLLHGRSTDWVTEPRLGVSILCYQHAEQQDCCTEQQEQANRMLYGRPETAARLRTWPPHPPPHGSGLYGAGGRCGHGGRRRPRADTKPYTPRQGTRERKGKCTHVRIHQLRDGRHDHHRHRPYKRPDRDRDDVLEQDHRGHAHDTEPITFVSGGIRSSRQGTEGLRRTMSARDVRVPQFVSV